MTRPAFFPRSPGTSPVSWRCRDLLVEPKATAHLLVHCHADVSRSTACMALVLAQALPRQLSDAILERVQTLREKAWPNLRLIEIGDAMLGCGGTLVEATHALHRLQIERRPQPRGTALGGEGLANCKPSAFGKLLWCSPSTYAVYRTAWEAFMGVMQVQLPDDLKQAIDRQVAEGRAASEADYVVDALRLYAEHLNAEVEIAAMGEWAT